ncbi:MAG: DUF1993 domain-containing protein [Myxococcota bacterium]
MTPTQLLIPTYTQMLRALSAWLTKAEKNPSVDEAVMAAKLAPDMFPLSTQVRFSCVQAYEGVARLRDEEFPPIWYALLTEGRDRHETPGSIADANARVEEALAFLDAVDRGALSDDSSCAVALKLPDGRVFDMTSEQYVRDWAIPQFYFHVMTAYSLLRQAGVDLGKADYVQHAFAYLRSDNQ